MLGRFSYMAFSYFIDAQSRNKRRVILAVYRVANMGARMSLVLCCLITLVFIQFCAHPGGRSNCVARPKRPEGKCTCGRDGWKGGSQCARCALRARHRAWDRRAEVLKEYGGVCVNCGIDDLEVLVFDHIFDDGAEERKQLGEGPSMHEILRRQGFPKDRIQVLCHNCNHKKERARQRARWPKEEDADASIETARGHKTITHCKNGHEYTEETTARYSEGWRSCKICRAEAQARFRARNPGYADRYKVSR